MKRSTARVFCYVGTLLLLTGCGAGTPAGGNDGSEEIKKNLCGENEIASTELDIMGRTICRATPGRPVTASATRAAGNVRGIYDPQYGNLEYRPVKGWPDWMCADLGETARGQGTQTSRWYLISRGPSTAQNYDRSCAQWASDPEAAKYHPIPGYPDYMCADLPVEQTGGYPQCMIYHVGEGVAASTQRYSGTCASYARPSYYQPPTYYQPGYGYGGYQPVTNNLYCANSQDGQSSTWLVLSTGRQITVNHPCQYYYSYF